MRMWIWDQWSNMNLEAWFLGEANYSWWSIYSGRILIKALRGDIPSIVGMDQVSTDGTKQPWDRRSPFGLKFVGKNIRWMRITTGLQRKILTPCIRMGGRRIQGSGACTSSISCLLLAVHMCWTRFCFGFWAAERVQGLNWKYEGGIIKGAVDIQQTCFTWFSMWGSWLGCWCCKTFYNIVWWIHITTTF